MSMLLFLLVLFFLHFFNSQTASSPYSRPRRRDKLLTHTFNSPKPQWVRDEVMVLKAMLPYQGCRKIADTFNRLHAHKGVTIGKSFVNEVVRAHQYEIQVLRRQIKNKPPRDFAHNDIWGIDLTGKTDDRGKTHSLFGVVEFNSRACLSLTALKNKSSITLLRAILDCIEAYGMPKNIRTDNEAVFTSRVFQLGLTILGIRHQRIQTAAPWQNGRIERFFGTLKKALDGWQVSSFKQLNKDLGVFRFWYNQVRPHQNLGGHTPAEVWRGTNVFRNGYQEVQYFYQWEGLLTGYYLPT